MVEAPSQTLPIIPIPADKWISLYTSNPTSSRTDDTDNQVSYVGSEPKPVGPLAIANIGTSLSGVTDRLENKHNSSQPGGRALVGGDDDRAPRSRNERCRPGDATSEWRLKHEKEKLAQKLQRAYWSSRRHGR